eukprot:CAMPEP_0172816058 /NCGR_PEP_ID=MMETSP1075-20121228/12186_1 /TAXON_ID=2916 /ORGANISM="Ceratium fusus, Strain PA161109" /LENGTH=64 /DNA_ID=CAMNT_0013655985 /DNA_START=16 /DNA_END=211 /DNA_ORIENTATION=-
MEALQSRQKKTTLGTDGFPGGTGTELLPGMLTLVQLGRQVVAPKAFPDLWPQLGLWKDPCQGFL